MLKPINRCLNKQLLDICQRAAQLDELNSKVKAYLPTDLVEHCTVASFTRGTLILSTAHASWATELRYVIPELRDKLRKEAGFYQLVSIKIAVTEKTYQQPLAKAKTAKPLSEKSRKDIQAASELCQYPPLREALYQLSCENEPGI